MAKNDSQDFYLMRRHQVERSTGHTTASLYVAMREGTFPRPLKTGHNTVAWLSPEIESWKQARIAERDTGERTNPPFRYIDTVPIGSRMLRREEVLRRTGKAPSTLYKEVASGFFPSPVSISINRVVFLESEVNQWIQDRLTERNAKIAGSKTQ